MILHWTLSLVASCGWFIIPPLMAYVMYRIIV